jgi:DNA polymerase-3 subunit delta
VIVGEEEFLTERAISGLIAAARANSAGTDGVTGSDRIGDAGGGADASGDVHQRDAQALVPGELESLASPSLFGGGSVVVIRSVQNASKDIADELSRYVKNPAPDVVLIMTHAGGAKGKALLTALTAAGTAGPVRVIECPKITRAGDRLDFARAEFRRAGATIDEASLRALLEAVGNDLREIAAACDQLAADAGGRIDQSVVARYYRGRAEATGFSVADRAVEGHLGDALEQLRWALASGVAPVLITSALAQGVRLLGRVGAAPRGLNANALAADVGAPPWKIDRVRKQLRGWEPAGVSRALRAVAEADAQVKGEGTSPGYALEHAIRQIVASRAHG